jgi:diamine N-acetyltransferase
MTRADKYGVVLVGGGVRLRPLALEDAGLTLLWRLGDRTAFLQQGAQTETEQRAWIASHINVAGEFNFIVEYQGAPVGMVALHSMSHTNRSTVMGRLLIGEAARVGSAPVFFETELLLCDFVFDELKMHKVYGEIMEDNVGMVRARMYLGYKQDGVLRDHYFLRGAFRNAIAVSLLEDEYWSVSRPKLVQLISFLTPLK